MHTPPTHIPLRNVEDATKILSTLASQSAPIANFKLYFKSLLFLHVSRSSFKVLIHCGNQLFVDSIRSIHDLFCLFDSGNDFIISAFQEIRRTSSPSLKIQEVQSPVHSTRVYTLTRATSASDRLNC